MTKNTGIGKEVEGESAGTATMVRQPWTQRLASQRSRDVVLTQKNHLAIPLTRERINIEGGYGAIRQGVAIMVLKVSSIGYESFVR